MKITSNINNKFADTTVTAKVVNTAVIAEKKVFSVMLPNEAFVVGFIMEIGGQNYTSFVVENEEARNQFDSVRYPLSLFPKLYFCFRLLLME